MQKTSRLVGGEKRVCSSLGEMLHTKQAVQSRGIQSSKHLFLKEKKGTTLDLQTSHNHKMQERCQPATGLQAPFPQGTIYQAPSFKLAVCRHSIVLQYVFPSSVQFSARYHADFARPLEWPVKARDGELLSDRGQNQPRRIHVADLLM